MKLFFQGVGGGDPRQKLNTKMKVNQSVQNQKIVNVVIQQELNLENGKL